MKLKGLVMFLISAIGFTLIVFAVTEIISNIATVGRYQYKLGNVYLTLVILIVGIVINLIIYKDRIKRERK